MIVNQWVPAAHKGDAIGDSARKMRDMLRAMGRHPNRPGHVHMMVYQDGYVPVTTHLFPSDSP